MLFKMSKSANPNPGLTGFDHARSPRLTGLMDFFVWILGRDRVPVKMVVKASDTIALVKAKIYGKTMIPPDYQKLIIGCYGKQLEDSRPLSEYDIRNFQVLKLAVKETGDMSTQVGCDDCDSYWNDDHNCRVFARLCESCAANNAIAGEDPTEYHGIEAPPSKKQRRLQSH